MPKLSQTAVPSYRLHKPSGQAILTLEGRDIYLGTHDTPESREKYNRLIADWLANGRRLPTPTSETTVAEVLAGYWRHAETYYKREDDSLHLWRLTAGPTYIGEPCRFSLISFGPLRSLW